jgi:OOP family OmpA-OmpF porin
MRTTPLHFSILVATLFSAGIASAQAAGGLFYDPSNAASPTGKTIGSELYRTIGCPARELLGRPCPAPMAMESVLASGDKAARAEPVAAPVVPPPTPQPVAMAVAEPTRVVVPVPARTEEYCAILDIQFEIDRYDIQREVKEKLAVLATFMKKYPDNSAVVEGHTDDVGTDEHNMKLSQRRADSVVDYLVHSHGIAPSRLTAVGYGETRPLGDNASEEGKRQNRRIDAVIGCVTDIAGQRVVPARITMALLIEFDRNQAEVKPEYASDLQKVADFMRENPSVTATVEGHTGNLQGTPELAMDISRRRAQNVVNTLVDNYDVARSRLAVEGFGQTRRFAYNTSLVGQQENRRVNVIFNFSK